MGVVEFERPSDRIIVALDVDELDEAMEIVQELEGLDLMFKVGNQLGTWEGWRRTVEAVHATGARVFADTKFKDIPKTVEKSARSITRHQPDMFNIMADNSDAALSGAVLGREDAITEFGLDIRPILLGVTVLTSMKDDCESIYGADVMTKVAQFAGKAAMMKLDGVVCSPQEAVMLRETETTSGLILVTPGIRPEWAPTDDQQRIMTPALAVAEGSDYLVIGRPITDPPNEIGSRREAAEMIIEELEAAA